MAPAISRSKPKQSSIESHLVPIKKEAKEEVSKEERAIPLVKSEVEDEYIEKKDIKKEVKKKDMKIMNPLKTVAKGVVKKLGKAATKTQVPKANAKPVKSKDLVVPTFDLEKVNLAKQRAEKTGYYVGAHVSAAGGVTSAIINTVDIGASACAFFVKSQRKWNENPRPKQHCDAFKKSCESIGFDQSKILVHGSYLINLAQKEPEKRQRALDAMIDEMQRCKDLGITYYNFHPGSATDGDRPNSLKRISEGMNHCLSKVEDVVLVVECMAGQGNVLGRTYQELKTILDGIDEDKKHRTGICLDTCHMFAAGYDIRSSKSFAKTLDEFDKIIGIDKLKGVHLNDSKTDLDSRVDRHENLGKGKIGEESFKFIMNEPRFKNIPMILETPEIDGNTGYRNEVTHLYSLVKDYSEE